MLRVVGVPLDVKNRDTVAKAPWKTDLTEKREEKDRSR